MTELTLVVRNGTLYTCDLTHGPRPAMPRFSIKTEHDALATALWFERRGMAEMAERIIEEWLRCHKS